MPRETWCASGRRANWSSSVAGTTWSSSGAMGSNPRRSRRRSWPTRRYARRRWWPSARARPAGSVAFVEAQETPLPLLALKKHLAGHLPRYMIIDEVRYLPALPRTAPTGKSIACNSSGDAWRSPRHEDRHAAPRKDEDTMSRLQSRRHLSRAPRVRGPRAAPRRGRRPRRGDRPARARRHRLALAGRTPRLRRGAVLIQVPEEGVKPDHFENLGALCQLLGRLSESRGWSPRDRDRTAHRPGRGRAPRASALGRGGLRAAARGVRPRVFIYDRLARTSTTPSAPTVSRSPWRSSMASGSCTRATPGSSNATHARSCAGCRAPIPPAEFLGQRGHRGNEAASSSSDAPMAWSSSSRPGTLPPSTDPRSSPCSSPATGWCCGPPSTTAGSGCSSRPCSSRRSRRRALPPTWCSS